MQVDGNTPKHKILCNRKFYRYVVACMHNCNEEHFCPEFWRFFEAIGSTPVEYYNRDGIGEAVMRRVVFDCDRCGKKDVEPVFGLYNRDGESEEHRLSEEGFFELLASAGKKDKLVAELSFSILEKVEEARGWIHYCDKCFGKMSDTLGQFVNVKKPPKKKPKKKESKPAPADDALGLEKAGKKKKSK